MFWRDWQAVYRVEQCEIRPGGRVFVLQAEDGIRDYKVTGVQTCALPIWEVVSSGTLTAGHLTDRGDVWTVEIRSEERRVGKEGRSRWSPDHLKKNENINLHQRARSRELRRADMFVGAPCPL